MDRIEVPVGDATLSLTIDEAERLTLELAAALYWARQGANA